MDETQKRKISAKEFLEKNKQVGLFVLVIFFLLFFTYFIFIFFYAKTEENKQISNLSANGSQNSSEESFLGTLLPVFTVNEQADPNLDDGFLNNFSNPNIVRNEEDDPTNDLTKIIKVENKPIIGFAVFDKPISIKNYIKNKPKICGQKIEPYLKKDEESTAVLNFQNTLKSVDSFEDTPITGILDEKTREKIYIFQKRYADILYKNKKDKSPTRVIDVETAHFVNLLCNFDTENKDDFVQVPTLRYALKETREIFDYNTDSKEKKQVEAKLATGTADVVFSKNGDFAVFRKENLGTIESIFYNIRTKASIKLENNLTTLDFDSKNILYYGVPGNDGMIIKTYSHLNNKAERVATIPLNEWNIFSISDKELGISSKPSAYSESIYMLLNLETKKLRQAAGPLLGFSVQKTNYPEFSILSSGGQGNIKTLLLNTKTRKMGDFGISTFAEKCSQTIFADGIFCAVPKKIPENFIYPDDWYKGKVQTEDVIMYKSLSGTSTRIVSYLENKPLSIINLNVNKNGIFFMDEGTYSLFSLEL